MPRRRGESLNIDPGPRIYRLGAVLLGIAATALVQFGIFDQFRAVAAATTWPLDALLFVILSAVLGLLLAERRICRNICEEVARRTVEERTARDLALRDPLTGLLNRRGLEHVATEMAEAGGRRMLFLADFDGFKAVNDTFGHATGDDLLRHFADRLRTIIGATGHAARLGGDEFVVVAPGDAVDDIGTLIAAGSAVSTRCGSDVEIAASVGATLWDELSLETALEQADLAMYEAKRLGLGLCRFDRLADEPHWSKGPADRVFERKLAALSHPDAPMCVAALSLDRYHNAKRTLGYGFAARLLRAVRARLEEHRPNLLIERLGPDTLGVLFPAEGTQEALGVLEALNLLSAQSHMLDGVVVDSPLTIGMAGPAPASCLRETVEQAQCALDEARRVGKRQVVFDLREQHRTAQNVKLMGELQQAIASDRLVLHYQPKLNARSGEIDSVEALVRWNHPERGLIMPGEFVKVAEESGDIRALTLWVVQRALADSARMKACGLERPIYVNISAQLVGDAEFATNFLSMVKDRNDSIGIEITETGVLENPDRALAHLRAIAEAGIKIAIDDYGVGLSSLAYLKQLPATELKIDMLFITDLAESHRDPLIVRSTIDLAHGLGLRVTAEGVDKPEALALLKIMGCDLIQGHLISKALPLPELQDFILWHDSGAEHVPDCAARLLALVSG